ncbi:peptidase metallopeptidase [Methylorubrum sp. Q1]|uniref:Hint domain-containing protein n=1 Tax=Methylorubrum sp. Q1 TaxID=2562453 RepID=UPI00107629B0|nr:Hint domain-containing protein [Methylorubrum sp. Q1]TFZ58838.1 peptidase metallopeptidase [Methylorubrum sp. Q1]
MATLTDEQRKSVTYLAGMDENGAIASLAWRGWRRDNPATYWTDRSFVNKWNNDSDGNTLSASSKAGTPGGVVTYSFAPGVSVLAKAAYREGLNLWADIVDIRFKEVPLSPGSNLVLDTDVDRGAVTTSPGSVRTNPGATEIPSVLTPVTNPLGYSANVNIPDNNNGYGVLGDFTTRGVSTVTHELGHMLGLGHAGPYNAGVAASSQFNAYDSQQWSVMSYITANNTRTPFYAENPVKGSNWTEAHTPMMLDIEAAQRIYGASKTSTFSGGQVYGFNANISGTSNAYYNFSYNSAPVVTIYNTGTGNSLDLSGYSTGSTINLNPGSFSSAGGLINNIGIAYNTRIDTAIGGAGNDIIYTNGNGNRIDGGGGTNRVIFAKAETDYQVVRTAANAAIVTDRTTGAVDTLTNVQEMAFAAPVCFTSGTRLRVFQAGGVVEVAVEALRVGDVAVTATGGRRKIRWIGQRTVVPATCTVPSQQWPVRVRAGAFGSDPCGRLLPVRDLRLSQGHPVLVAADEDNRGGVLVPIMCLINGTSIMREPASMVTYWHVELDAHDILLAENLPAESYIDGGDRAFFVKASDDALHNPDFVAPGWTARCRPVLIDGPVVEAERARINTLFVLALEGNCAWPPFESAHPTGCR